MSEPRAADVRRAQVGTQQIRRSEARPAQIGADQIGAPQARVPQVGAAEVRAGSPPERPAPDRPGPPPHRPAEREPAGRLSDRRRSARGGPRNGGSAGCRPARGGRPRRAARTLSLPTQPQLEAARGDARTVVPARYAVRLTGGHDDPMPGARSVAVIGAGAMGTALACHLHGGGSSVSLLATERDGESAAAWGRGAPHPRLLVPFPDVPLYPPDRWGDVLPGVDLVLVAVTSVGLARVLADAAPAADSGTVWALATKGWEPDTLRTPSEVAAGVLDPARVVSVSGPALAAELAVGAPTGLICAARDRTSRRMARRPARHWDEPGHHHVGRRRDRDRGGRSRTSWRWPSGWPRGWPVGSVRPRS